MATITDRSWKSEPKFYESPVSNEFLWLSGMRDDGTKFVMKCPVQPFLSPAQFNSVTAYHRQKFDTFLDPNCSCVPGMNCELHKHIDQQEQ